MLNKLNTTPQINIFRANRLIYFAENNQDGPKEEVGNKNLSHLQLGDRSNLDKIKLRGGITNKKFVEAALKNKLPKPGLSKIIETIANRDKERGSDIDKFQKKLVKGDFNNESPLASLVAKSLAAAPIDSDEYECAADISRINGRINDSQDGLYKTILAPLIKEREGENEAELAAKRGEVSERTSSAGKTAPSLPTDKLDREKFPAESAQRLNAFSRQFLVMLGNGTSEKELSDFVEKHKLDIDMESDYLESMRGQIFKVNNFAKELGLNISQVIKIWMNNDESKGIIINPHTLKAERKIGAVTIHRVWAKNADDQENKPVSYIRDAKKDNPAGSLMVDYTDAMGVRHQQEPDQNFRNMILALNGHNELDEKEFADQTAIALGMKSIQECIDQGDEFIYEISEGQDENGIVDSETVKFKIIAYDGKTVTVNPPIVTLKKEIFANTTPDPLYHDHIKTTFTLGEFAAFAERASVERILSSSERTEVYRRANEHSNELARREFSGVEEEALVGLKIINKTPLAPPRVGENMTVVLSNEQGEQKVLDLTSHKAADGRKVYTYCPVFSRNGLNVDDIESLDDARRKMNKARTQGPYQGAPHGALSERELMQLSSDGYVRKATEDEHNKSEALGHRMENEARQKAQKNRAAMVDKSGGQNNMVEEESTGIPDEDPVGGSPTIGGEEAPDPTYTGSSLDPPKVYEEALAYDDVFKAGGMTKSDRGVMVQIWRETRVLSVGDIWALCKAGYEYYIRRFERKQKGKYSSVAKGVPFFAPEMQRINQSAETEEVNQFKETFDQKGIWEIQDTLRNTKNQDEMKAAFITLSSKGQLRWDDIELWENINNFVDSEYRIPIPANRDPKTQVSATDERTGFDFLKDAIDSLWGEGGFNDWFATNKSAYQSGAQKYDEEGKKLEGVEGGHGKRLSILLKAHKEGHFVDPHEYEGLILHSIEAGKSTMQEKIYYMVQGVAARNPQGRTILDSDRMAHINSEKLMKFPILEYMCASLPRKDGKGSYRLGVEDYRYWAELFDGGDVENPDNNKPSAAVDRFMWKYVIPSEQTLNRINKAIRHGEGLDHDDMFAYLPPTSEQVITDATMGMAGGGKKFFTVEGYANAIPGFSQYMKSLAENDNKEKLLQSVRSYVRFESILMNRYKKDDPSHQRFDDATLKGGTIVSPNTPPITFINENNQVVKNLVAHYAQYDPKGELARIGSLIYKDVDRPKQHQKEQDDVQDALEKFGGALARAVEASPDKGNAMVNIVKSANLTGMKFMSSAEKDAAKAAKAAANPSSAE